MPENTQKVGARVLPAHEMKVTPAPTASIARAVLDAIGDAGLDGNPPADIVVIAVPPGRGNGALNVAAKAIELDLAGEGDELERRLYGT